MRSWIVVACSGIRAAEAKARDEITCAIVHSSGWVVIASKAAGATINFSIVTNTVAVCVCGATSSTIAEHVRHVAVTIAGTLWDVGACAVVVLSCRIVVARINVSTANNDA